MMDVTALGELLIDFTDSGMSSQNNPLLEANPGGAPCNVLAMLTRLGNRTAFIGKVGDDYLGNFLRERVSALGIDTTCLSLDEKIHTTLAFVHTDADGDRDFSFYRNPGADMMLTADEIREDVIRDSKILHFGSLSMTHEGVRAATKKAIQIAKEHQVLISFDPNLREPLWESLEDAREQIAFGMSQCDIMKISDNEIQWFTGETDYDQAVKVIRSQYDIPLILVSMGKDGSRAYYKEHMVESAAILQEQTIETTGAGDTFDGCVLDYIVKHGLKHLTTEDLKAMLNFANAAASLITTRKGALSVMPEKAEILALLESRGVSYK